MKFLRMVGQFALVALAILMTTNSALAKQCYIAIDECGYQSLGDVNWQLNMLPNWSMTHSYSTGQLDDGTWYAGFVVIGVQHASICSAMFMSVPGVFMCQPSAGAQTLQSQTSTEQSSDGLTSIVTVSKQVVVR